MARRIFDEVAEAYDRADRAKRDASAPQQWSATSPCPAPAIAVRLRGALCAPGS
jgi:hypothetical protein